MSTNHDPRIEAVAKALYETEPPYCDHNDRPLTYDEALSPIGQFNYQKRAKQILAAADQFGIDALLDSVHPKGYIEGMKFVGNNEWRVWIMWPGYMWGAVLGTGPTREAAIRDAVAKAREAQP